MLSSTEYFFDEFNLKEEECKMYVIARAQFVDTFVVSTYYAKCFCIRIHNIIAIIFFPMAAVNLRNWSGEIVYL